MRVAHKVRALLQAQVRALGRIPLAPKLRPQSPTDFNSRSKLSLKVRVIRSERRSWRGWNPLTRRFPSRMHSSMHKEPTSLGAITLVGISVRTNNATEMNPEMGKIGALWGTYLSGQLAEKILHRQQPGVTYGVYTEYASDESGDYTCFIGEAVESLDGQDLSQFKILSIAPAAYQKFTTEPGPMPGSVIAAWQQIWAMTPEHIGSSRAYVADFERYDECALDPNKGIVDIYIGLKEQSNSPSPLSGSKSRLKPRKLTVSLRPKATGDTLIASLSRAQGDKVAEVSPAPKTEGLC